MKKSIKRLGALGLVIVLLISAITGCGKEGVNNPVTVDTNANSEKEDIGKGGNESEDPVKFYYVNTDRKAIMPANEEVRQLINEKFGVDYVKVDIPRDQYEAKMSIMLMTGEQMDCFNADPPSNAASPYNLPNLISNNYIQPLNAYLDKAGANIKAEVPEELWKYVTDDEGQIWGIPETGFKAKHTMFARQDWMEEYDISTPETIEEFETMLRIFKEEVPKSNGGKEIYPFIVWQNQDAMPYLDIALAGSFIPSGASWYEEDGLLKPYFLHENYKLYLETIRRWYKDGLIHPDFLFLKDEQVKDMIQRGVSGVHVNWYSQSREDETKINFPEAQFTYIQMPEGPSGTFGATSQDVVRSSFVINSNVSADVAEKIVEVADWFNTPEGTAFQWYGIENDHWVKDGDKIAPPAGEETYPYTGHLYMNVGNAWKYFDEPAGNTNRLKSDFRQDAIQGVSAEVQTIDPVDYMFPYNWTDTVSGDYLSDLELKMPQEMFAEIVTGVQALDYWDEWVQLWLEKGGQTYIEERTEQYNNLKAQYGNN